MPNVSAVGGEAAEDDIPLLNAAGPDDQPEAASAGDDFEDAEEDIEEVERSACSDCSSPRRWEEEEPEGEDRFPKDDGRCYDDPLWFGKSLGEIRLSTDRAKVMGNEASRAGDWKAANRCWKDSLRGAEKLKDVELELRLRLNLALGYVRRGKPERALEHCDEIFRARLKSAASAELRAKAHFRRGEAYEAAGEESKAAASFTAALDVEPGNAEVRRKLAALKKLEAARQGREREFFRGKLAGAAPADPADAARTGAPPAAAGARPPAAAALEPAAEEAAVRGLTDRAAAAKLAALLGAGQRRGPALGEDEKGAGQQEDSEEGEEVDLPGINMEVLPQVEIFGALNPPSATAAGSATAREGEAAGVSQPD